jgi:solute carrier family 25 carnitine/acylcarnitine transporter 20/29
MFCRMSNWSYFGAYHVIQTVVPKPVAKHGGLLDTVSRLCITVLGGGAAGICYWLSCYPLDVIKGRIMTDDAVHRRYTGTLDCVSKMYREGGWRVFYRGFSPCIMRAIPANAACFLAYEGVMAMLPENLTLNLSPVS